MVVVNLLGNSLVCLVVLRDKNMRTTMNFLLVNLAISDMIVGVFSTFRLVIHDSNPSTSSESPPTTGVSVSIVTIQAIDHKFLWFIG